MKFKFLVVLLFVDMASAFVPQQSTSLISPFMTQVGTLFSSKKEEETETTDPPAAQGDEAADVLLEPIPTTTSTDIDTSSPDQNISSTTQSSSAANTSQSEAN